MFWCVLCVCTLTLIFVWIQVVNKILLLLYGNNGISAYINNIVTLYYLMALQWHAMRSYSGTH